jgi:CRISPR-associated protein Csb1
MVHLDADRLIDAVREESDQIGIVVSAVYQPMGGAGGRLMPPTFSKGQYLMESRFIDGEKTETVVLDQVPSQANRIEEALRLANDRGRVELPMFELAMQTERGPVRLTSLDFPHRYADAYLRDSEVDGVRFDKSPIGKTLRATSVDDVRPLYEREPYSLLFGAWDSHRAGRWPKFARIYSSEMYGLHPIEGKRRGTRMDQLNLVGGVDDRKKAESTWAYAPQGTRAKGQKLSEIGHGNIAPVDVHGGVTVTEVRRRACLSFAGLERLRFGDASQEATDLARATLTALALAGDRLAFGKPSLRLRSGCDLTRYRETIGFEVAGGEVEQFELTASQALNLFVELRDRTTKAGVRMAADTIPVTPIPELAKAISFAITKADPDAEE